MLSIVYPNKEELLHFYSTFQKMDVITASLYDSKTLAQKVNITDIIKEYQHRLQGFIRKRVGTMEDAEDILQDVYYQLTLADVFMKPIDQISAWLFTVARNRITDLYRKKKPELLPEYASDEESSIFEEFHELLFDNGNTPETEYLNAVIWEEIDKVLDELPIEQRQAFELSEIQGLSFNEIAEQTGEPVNTLISRKRYAVLYLRERLKILYDELINF